MTSATSDPNDSNRPIFVDMPLESSASLESSAPLDFRNDVQQVTPQPQRSLATPPPNFSTTQTLASIDAQEGYKPPASVTNVPLGEELERQEVTSLKRQPSLKTTNRGEEITVQLREERLVVDRKRRKIGEVIVRKEIETQIIEVPVRREKLIVEQIGADVKQLAVIDLGQAELDGVAFADAALPQHQPTINGEFTSVKAASQFLGTIAAAQPDLDCQTVQIKIVAENEAQAKLYQQWFDRYSVNNAATD